MKKNILSLLFIALTTVLFTACEKEEEEAVTPVVTPVEEECKTCGFFITFDDTLTDEEIATLQEEDDDFVDDTEEYCGDELSAFESDMEANGGEITQEYPDYTVFGGCQ